MRHLIMQDSVKPTCRVHSGFRFCGDAGRRQIKLERRYTLGNTIPSWAWYLPFLSL
jgi:hypothetical protein